MSDEMDIAGKLADAVREDWRQRHERLGQKFYEVLCKHRSAIRENRDAEWVNAFRAVLRTLGQDAAGAPQHPVAVANAINNLVQKIRALGRGAPS